MGISTSTGTLIAGQSRTFNLSPASAVTLTLSPNVRVTITETPATVAATGLGGNASRVHEPRLPGVVTYGPYPMGGSVLVEVESNSGSSVGWSQVDALLSRDSSGNPVGFTYSDGTRDIFRVASNSWLQLGVTAQGSGKELVNFTRLDTNADAVARPVMVYMDHAVNPAVAPGSTTDFHALDVKTYGGSANINANTRFYCIEGKANMQKTSGTALRGVGVMGSVVNSGAGGTLTLGVGVQTDVQNTSSGTMTEGVGLYVPSGVSSGGGAITTLYGIKIENQTAGGTNYSVYTGTGAVKFFGGTAVPAGGTAGVGVTMSSTANLGVFFGSGVPTLSAAQGSLYMRTDGSTTSTRMYVNTNGTTGWTAVTTAA